MSTVMRIAALACAAALAPACAGAEGTQQGGLAARVAAAPNGEVWMHFASRPGVCGGENGISIRDGRNDDDGFIDTGDHDHGRNGWECVHGPVYVALVKEGGRVEDLRVRVARAWSTDGRGRITDLGAVPAREAADYLLGLAERTDDGRVGEKAVFPPTLADSVTTWPALLRIAKSTGSAESTRRSAVFWLSQQAGDRITRELAGFVNDNAEDRELRKHAVFALSQRPQEEAVPELIRIARTHHDPEIRKNALFWLGQSHDPRALALFQEILER